MVRFRVGIDYATRNDVQKNRFLFRVSDDFPDALPSQSQPDAVAGLASGLSEGQVLTQR